MAGERSIQGQWAFQAGPVQYVVQYMLTMRHLRPTVLRRLSSSTAVIRWPGWYGWRAQHPGPVGWGRWCGERTAAGPGGQERPWIPPACPQAGRSHLPALQASLHAIRFCEPQEDIVNSWLCQVWLRQNRTMNGPSKDYLGGHQTQTG